MSDRYRAGKRLWSEEDDALLRERYPHEPTASLAADLRRTISSVYQRAKNMGLKKSDEYLASPAACRLRRGDNVGAACRFQEGHVPANKGLRRPGYAPGRMKETQFKKGHRSGIAASNWKPIGTILTDTDGYLRIKVREAQHGKEATGFGNTRVWPLLQRHVWEQTNGPIPSDHVICFKDGNKQNCAIENLECISRAERMSRNTIHNLPKELVRTLQLLGALNRQINRRVKNDEEQD